MKKKLNSNYNNISSSQNEEDMRLIVNFKKTGNTHLIYQLMDRYSTHIIAFSMNHLKNHEDVKDFTNDIFIKLCDKLQKENVLNFKSWLYVFMKNMFYDAKRKEKLHHNFVSNQSLSKAYNIENKLFNEIDKTKLYNSLEILSEHERKCVDLLYMQGKSYNEIMKETNWTFNQLRGIRDRATKKLRENISTEFKEFNQ